MADALVWLGRAAAGRLIACWILVGAGPSSTTPLLTVLPGTLLVVAVAQSAVTSP